MRIPRGIGVRSGWSALTVSVVVGLLVSPLSGCSSNAEQEKPAYALDGMYQLAADGAQLTDMGEPDPAGSWERSFAIRTSCKDQACTSAALPLDDEDHSRLAAGDDSGAIVADFLDGRWLQVERDEWVCSDGSVGTQTVEWSLEPRDDGTFAGTRTDVRVASPECIAVLQQPITLTRIGELDPAIELPDPAAEGPWRPSAPAGLTGDYRRVATEAVAATAGVDPAVDRADVEFHSMCVRNTDECVALKMFDSPEGKRVVPLLFDHGRWSLSYQAGDATCPEGAAKGAETVHEQIAMPDDTEAPLQTLTGSEVATVSGGCSGVIRDLNLAFERMQG